jgi:hypothetical protein
MPFPSVTRALAHLKDANRITDRICMFPHLCIKHVKHARMRALFGLGEFFVRLSTVRARKPLRALTCPPVLVDTSFFGHAVTHETALINTGTQLWGGVFPTGSGYMARIPVHDSQSAGRLYREICFIIPLAELANQGLVHLHTSAEILAEIHRQPYGRFTGYGRYDLCVIHWADAPSVDGTIIDLEDNPKQTQLDRVHGCSDPLYQELRSLFSPKQSLDVFHIYTASKHNIHFFVHIDFPLNEAIQQNKSKEAFRKLGVDVMLPSEFGKKFGLVPVPPVVISGRGSSFIVRPDLHWQENRRRPLGANKR